MEGAMTIFIVAVLFAAVGYMVGGNIQYNAGYLDGLRGEWRRKK